MINFRYSGFNIGVWLGFESPGPGKAPKMLPRLQELDVKGELSSLLKIHKLHGPV